VTNRKILTVYKRILCEVCVGRTSLYICAQQNSSGGGYTSTVHKRSTYSTYSEADLEGGVWGVHPLKFAKRICYTTLFKEFNKQLFHEWLTRDL
jgi:hypothetical protein